MAKRDDDILVYGPDDIERIPPEQDPGAPQTPPPAPLDDGPETPGEAVVDALRGFAGKLRGGQLPVPPPPAHGQPPAPGFPWKAMLAGAAGAVVVGLTTYGIRRVGEMLDPDRKPRRRRRRGRRRNRRQRSGA
jgi:hypothetical protein